MATNLEIQQDTERRELSIDGEFSAVSVDVHHPYVTITRPFFEDTPVFWRRERNRIRFAADPRRLASLTPNPKVCLDYLSVDDDSDSQDFVLGVNRMRPGEILRVSPTSLRSEISRPPVAECYSERDASDALWRVLVSAADTIPSGSRVVLASCGGLDSSVIGAALREAGCDFAVASMVAPGFSKTDESAWGEQLALCLNTPWLPFDMTEYLPFADLGAYQTEPEWGPHLHPGESYELAFFEELAKDFDVVVGGWGADEIFSLRRDTLAQRSLRRGDWRTWLSCTRTPGRILGSIREFGAQAAWSAGLRAASSVHEPLSWSVRSRRAVPPSRRSHDPEMLEGLGWELAQRTLARYRFRSGLSFVQPFKSTRMWELAFSTHPLRVAAPQADKIVLRQAARGRLTPSLAERPKDTSFDQVIRHGFMRHSDSIRELAKDPRLASLGWIDREAFFKAVSTAIERDGAGLAPLWRTIATELWLRRIGEM